MKIVYATTLVIWLLAGGWNLSRDTPKPVTEHTDMWIETAPQPAVLPDAPPINCTPIEQNFHPQRCSVGVI